MRKHAQACRPYFNSQTVASITYGVQVQSMKALPALCPSPEFFHPPQPTTHISQAKFMVFDKVRDSVDVVFLLVRRAKYTVL